MSPPWTAGFSFHRQLWTTSQRSVAEPTRHEETKPKSIAITGIFGFFLVVLNAALRFAVGARDSTQNEKGKETESSSGAWLDFRVSTFPSIRFDPLRLGSRQNPLTLSPEWSSLPTRPRRRRNLFTGTTRGTIPEIWFPRLIVVPVYSQEVAGVRKEKERLTAAADSFSFIRTRAATLS